MNVINHRECVTDEGLRNVCLHGYGGEEENFRGCSGEKFVFSFFTHRQDDDVGQRETDDDGVLIFHYCVKNYFE